MFTSRSIIFVLLSFLASTDACVQCPAKMQVDSINMYIFDTFVDDKITFCIYNGKTSDGSAVYCNYTAKGKIQAGNQSCPRAANVLKDRCS
ncbi:uncharacterized protein EDB91DRAFT_1163894 [Suillus paluster]|uniref:uncharacterized protein n=1 Tax=Suillus paluster TaxID=48578 RepID=UPI001B86D53C|nr:uncharacterized protein EDB91DRAFT_1163894 [Suillus paluster]KAG1727465.1 hypothetical protein EDB91DRAFT_1163894 [Suillus paluster]